MPAPDTELLNEWFAKVDDDLRIIRALTSFEDFSENGVAFHAQQASEKMLKIVLLAQGIKPPYIHSLKRLTDLLQSDFPLRPQLLELLRFENMHLDSRYPSEGFSWEPPTREDAWAWLALLSGIRTLLANTIFEKESP